MEEHKSPLIATIYKSIKKKEQLIDTSYSRYAVRSVFAALFMVLGIAVACYVGAKADAIAPGAGKFTYSFMFSWALIMIIFMNAELGTSNMMYMTGAAYTKQLSVVKALKILFTCILFNLIGAVFISYVVSLTTPYSHLETDHFLFKLVADKLQKEPLTLFLDGIFANIIVNVAVVMALRIKDDIGKITAVQFVILIFVFLGFEHVIANFVYFPLAYFSGGINLGITFSNMLVNFLFSGLGNFVGGGLIIGFVYHWLNDQNTSYVD